MKIMVIITIGGTTVNRMSVSYQVNINRSIRLPTNYTMFLINIDILSLAASYTKEISEVNLDINSPDLF